MAEPTRQTQIRQVGTRRDVSAVCQIGGGMGNHTINISASHTATGDAFPNRNILITITTTSGVETIRGSTDSRGEYQRVVESPTSHKVELAVASIPFGPYELPGSIQPSTPARNPKKEEESRWLPVSIYRALKGAHQVLRRNRGRA
ncbi:MAG: hypothetical protein HY007_02355 [Candidatus Sungbacteria bacterium]|nr:hypothetical protein [Candidatus Sungbacteria bacterium]